MATKAETTSKFPAALGVCHRVVAVEDLEVIGGSKRDDGTDEDIRLALTFSSEIEVPRYYGTEILGHKPEEVDLSLADTAGLAFLVGHDSGEYSRPQIGLVEDIAIKGRRLRGTVRFSRADDAQRFARDIQDGIRPYVSVGYRVLEATLVKSSKEGGDVYRMTRWRPMEVSTVAVPADASVGFGRSEGTDLEPVRLIGAGEIGSEARETTMTEEEIRAAAEAKRKADETQAAERAAAEEARLKERLAKREAEIAEIVALCAAHGDTRASEFIAAGKTKGEVAAAILEARSTAPLRQPPAERAPGVLTDASKRPPYRLVKAIRQALETRESGTTRLDGYEAECHQEIERALPKDTERHNGIYVPLAMSSDAELGRSMRAMVPGLMKRAGLDSQTVGSGTELVFEQAGDFIELLRNMSVIQRAGARMLTGLVGPVTWPKQTSAGTAYWVGENPSDDVSLSYLGLGDVSVAPKTLMSATAYSRQLLAQTSYDVEAMTRADMIAIHALAIDRSGLHGTGTEHSPQGIYQAAGVQSVAMGGVPTFGKLVDMATAAAVQNALMGTLGYVTTPGMAGKLMQTLVASAAGSAMIWQGNHVEGTIAGYRALATNQVAAVMNGSAATGGTSHGIVFGDWSSLIVALWGAMELTVDPFTLAGRALIKVTSYQLADMALRYPQSLVKATGATIS